MKATAKAPSNIAFVKYWGRKNEELRLPSNGSISMNLSGLYTVTTVDFSADFIDDEIEIGGKNEFDSGKTKVSDHLDRIRKLARIDYRAKVVSENSFPRGTGLSSSASGFAALTVAAVSALELQLTEKELSILARHGSGSACRSIPDGFVEWLVGETSETSYAYSLFPPNHWDITDIVCILTEDVKTVSTTDGQKLAETSTFYPIRQAGIQKKIRLIKEAIADRDFTKLGEISESEALEMHSVMLTSHPSLIYWNQSTIRVMKSVKKWRSDGLPVYFTLNTGQNIHLLCEKKGVDAVLSRLKSIKEIKQTIVSSASNGAHTIEEHLF